MKHMIHHQGQVKDKPLPPRRACCFHGGATLEKAVRVSPTQRRTSYTFLKRGPERVFQGSMSGNEEDISTTARTPNVVV